ncbi:GNAT family N-acetyltransferase [Blastococcus sp. VKM Ac-2987]|uniref:GNAT family N-acetyltransferase n=1 Tax=Blastococcus sp. VKM Ac-2987 TaxID=3004141 RepID=UPI0022AB97FD|nr:GNAT family N-acetyltransferase [Blastococcus sp. VKM Ac-2987]MCZ2860363.1 GNAT family N-acetyltransferase [Blastococcus sp. VKM Ac-2987]
MGEPPDPAWGPLTGVAARVRPATAADLPALVALLADDALGRHREQGADLAPYRAAFERIDADPAHLLVVAAEGSGVVGTLQLSFVPGLSRGGALRAQVEAVRVRADRRSAGLGSALFRWAIAESRRRGCGLVQLTTDRSRADAHRFYEALGFVASHVGYKLEL